MKLFLASSLNNTISLLRPRLAKDPLGTKVLFIANAADPYDSDKFWIRWDREAFINAGYELIEVDLRNTSVEEFTKILNSVSILHICGGSVLYLMSLLRKGNFENAIREVVTNNKILYSSTSAGSMVVAPRLDLCTYDEEELEFVRGVTDFSGMNLVKFLIVPHTNQELFVENHKKYIEHLPKYPQPLILLQDNQVVWVEDGKFEILSL